MRCFKLARIKHNSKEIGLLARLMRSEAVGEGKGPVCVILLM